MSEDTLLSRRQILGLFGGGVGAAIIGSTSAQTDTQADGNLYGGINGMAQAYQVGEGMYKGPLSTRSEVPEKDGNTFIATDAGNNGNQFKFYHYNGGWAAQGWDLPSLNTERVGIDGYDLKVGFITDSHYQESGGRGEIPGASSITDSWDAFIQEMNNWGADMVFCLGDHVDGHVSSESTYDSLLTYAVDYFENGLNMPIHWVTGNHEGAYHQYGLWSQYGFSTYSDSYYTVEQNGVEFIVLNTTGGGTDGSASARKYHTYLQEQIDWLQDKLDSSEKPKIILTHISPHDLMFHADEYNASYFHVKNEEKVNTLINNAQNVMGVFFGHHHGSPSAVYGQHHQMHKAGYFRIVPPWGYSTVNSSSTDYSVDSWVKFTTGPQYTSEHSFGKLTASYDNVPTQTEWLLKQPKGGGPIQLYGEEGIGLAGKSPQEAGFYPQYGKNQIKWNFTQDADQPTEKLRLWFGNSGITFGKGEEGYLRADEGAEAAGRAGLLTSEFGPVRTADADGYRQNIRVDTSSNPVTISIIQERHQQGQIVWVDDVGGNAGTNAITVQSKENDSIDGSSSYQITTDYGSLCMIYTGNIWKTR